MRIVNQTIKLIFILFLSVVFSGCVRQSHNKVGLLLHDLEGRWFNDIEFLKKQALDAGLLLEVKIAGGDENKQLQQAEELVKEGVGVMLVVPVNKNTAGGIVRSAHKSGIQVIAYDRIIMNADLDYMISFEYYQIGKLIAEYSYNKVPMGNYVMLWGDASDNNAQLMRKGQEDYLKPFVIKGDINIIYRSYVEGWSGNVSAHTMQEIIDFCDQKIDVVMASNDNIGLAALDVFMKNNIEQPSVITGQDATLDACRSILNDGLTMSVYKSMNRMAKEAILLATDILQGNKIHQATGFVNNNRKDVPTLFLEPIVVDKSSVYDAVINDGVYRTDELMPN